jgi:hypothetical protein
VNSSFVPIYEKRFIGVDPIHNTLVRTYAGTATLPRREYVGWDPDFLDDMTFTCNSSKLLNYLTLLGYLEQEKQKELVFGYEGLQQLLKEYTKPDPPLYQYTVLRQLPNWVKDQRF